MNENFSSCYAMNIIHHHLNHEYDHFDSFIFFHSHYFSTLNLEILRFKEFFYFYENII